MEPVGSSIAYREEFYGPCADLNVPVDFALTLNCIISDSFGGSRQRSSRKMPIFDVAVSAFFKRWSISDHQIGASDAVSLVFGVACVVSFGEAWASM